MRRVMAGKDAGVDGGGLVADDLNPVEQLTQPRLRQFAFLIQQVALGDHDQPMAIGQRFHGFRRHGVLLEREVGEIDQRVGVRQAVEIDGRNEVSQTLECDFP